MQASVRHSSALPVSQSVRQAEMCQVTAAHKSHLHFSEFGASCTLYRHSSLTSRSQLALPKALHPRDEASVSCTAIHWPAFGPQDCEFLERRTGSDSSHIPGARCAPGTRRLLNHCLQCTRLNQRMPVMNRSLAVQWAAPLCHT